MAVDDGKHESNLGLNDNLISYLSNGGEPNPDGTGGGSPFYFVTIDKLLHLRIYPRSLMAELVYQFRGIDNLVLSNENMKYF